MSRSGHAVGRTAAALALAMVCSAGSGIFLAQEKRMGAEGAAELIFHGGEIVTLDAARPRAEALAVAGGKITALGSEEEALRLRGEATRVIGLDGRALIPALADHHLHLLNIGLTLLNRQRGEKYFLDLNGTRSIEEIAARVRSRAAPQTKGSWVLGLGWNQMSWGAVELPASDALDEAAPEHPVYLVRVDAHSAWVNRRALELAGITRETQDPHGGRIERRADGSPAGVLLERANEPVTALIPPLADEVIEAAFRAAARALAAGGYAEVFDAGFLSPPAMVDMGAAMERYLEALVRADAAEPLPLRINLMVPAPSALAEKVLAQPEKYRQLSPRVGVTHIKLFTDGALGSRGAWLHAPYTDDPATRGVQRMTAEELDREIARALAAGFDVATHAIGDAAVTLTLDAYESVLKKKPKLHPRRLRLEHISVATEADLARAARLGVVIVGQPGFVYPDAAGRTMEDARLGARCRGCYAWRTLLDGGAALAGSSDDYMAPIHPLWNFYAAATRKNPEGRPTEGWQPQQRLSREEALLLFTRVHAPGGAVGAGRLEAGAPANFAILSANPLTVPETEILRLAVHATLRGGRFTYGDGSARPAAAR